MSDTIIFVEEQHYRDNAYVYCRHRQVAKDTPLKSRESHLHVIENGQSTILIGYMLPRHAFGAPIVWTRRFTNIDGELVKTFFFKPYLRLYRSRAKKG